jgi:hypothetical protein
MIRKLAHKTGQSAVPWHVIVDTVATFDADEQAMIPSFQLKGAFILDASNGEVLLYEPLTNRDDVALLWQGWVKKYGSDCQGITVIVDPLAELAASVPPELGDAEKRLLAMSELDALYWTAAHSPAFSVTNQTLSVGGVTGYPNIIAMPSEWSKHFNNHVFSALVGVVPIQYVSRGLLCAQLSQFKSGQHEHDFAMISESRHYVVKDGDYQSNAVGRHSEPAAKEIPVITMADITSTEWLGFIQRIKPCDYLLEYGDTVQEVSSILFSQKLVGLFPLWAACLLLVYLFGMVLSHRVDEYQQRISLTSTNIALTINPLVKHVVSRGNH